MLASLVLSPLDRMEVNYRWHDDVIKWKHFPRNWPFVWGIHRSPVNSPHKGQWRGALMFSLICVWINDWVKNGEAGDLRRSRAHYDAIVMNSSPPGQNGGKLQTVNAISSMKSVSFYFFTLFFSILCLGSDWWQLLIGLHNGQAPSHYLKKNMTHFRDSYLRQNVRWVDSITSHERHGVSSYRPFEGLFRFSLKPTIKNTRKRCIIGLLLGDIGGTPHKGPVKRRGFSVKSCHQG